MSAETDAFAALMAEKREAKQKALAAMGEAFLADKEGRDSAPFWKTHAEQGMTSGVEGKKQKEMLAYADAYCAAHPELGEVMQGFAANFMAGDKELDELQACVKVVDMYRANGWADAVVEAEMYMLHRFEPQNVGGPMKARIRMPGGAA